jgi:hypothetical protein
MKHDKIYQLTEVVHGSVQQTKTDIGEISDGYHTFNELYHYRALLHAAWINSERFLKQHKSRKHSDGKFCFDADGEWFVVVIELPTGQFTNHYHSDYWDLFNIPEQETADEWDGHTSREAAERLEKYLKGEY